MTTTTPNHLVSAGSTPWLGIYQDLLDRGAIVGPRGLRTKELTGYHYTLTPYQGFCGFHARKLNLDYIRQELRWYLKGDTRDLSIAERAQTWKGCITDGQLHSNYGAYLFRQGGLRWCQQQLIADQESRRASVPILSQDHLFLDNRDVPCTQTVSFLIRDGQLDMYVHMRSQDAIYGMGNDAPFFIFTWELLLNLLRPWYPDLVLGRYRHAVISLHVYERHWAMLERLASPSEPWHIITRPTIQNAREACAILQNDLTGDEPFTRWLTADITKEEYHE